MTKKLDYSNQINDFYKLWITAGRPKTSDFAVQTGKSKRTVQRWLRDYALGVSQNADERLATLQGFNPDHGLIDVVPKPLRLTGTSTMVRTEEGLPKWLKTKVDEDMLAEAMREAARAFLEDMTQIDVAPCPLDYQDDIIPWIQIGDAHLGMLAHTDEIGENFDLKIAEQEICKAISILIDELPNCERMVINDLGDFTHYENFTGTTEASGHPLDYDTRFPKMIHVYSRVFRFIIQKALTKAKFVDVIINQGNHSRTNDIWMAEVIDIAYGHTGRVNILNNSSIFIAYRMGKTLVMTHHSDKCKPNRLCNVMTHDFRKDYGETEFHYIDIGHVHHGMVMKEHPGIVVESFNHLAAMDRWAHDSGYRNRKSITVILRSKTYGEIGRRLLHIKEIRDRLGMMALSVPKEKQAYTV